MQSISRAELYTADILRVFQNANDDRNWSKWMGNYIKIYAERDVRSLFPQLNLQSFRRLVQMMAHASGTMINYSDYARSLDVSQPT